MLVTILYKTNLRDLYQDFRVYVVSLFFRKKTRYCYLISQMLISVWG